MSVTLRSAWDVAHTRTNSPASLSWARMHLTISNDVHGSKSICRSRDIDEGSVPDRQRLRTHLVFRNNTAERFDIETACDGNLE
jgi:hypothetical protein